MNANRFFKPAIQLNAAVVAELCGGQLATESLADSPVLSLCSLENPHKHSLVFSDGKSRAGLLAGLSRCTLICTAEETALVGSDVAVITVKKPQQAFVDIAQKLYPEAVAPTQFCGPVGISAAATIHSSASLESNVTVESGAIIGANVQIGSGSVIGAQAVIGADVSIGRNCTIGPGATVLFALVGNDVMIHPGARIGQDGFGFIAGPTGLNKVPQLGRVIIQDKVEIGANTTIDRGAIDDTIIGEGTKIDNLVQIAHNCRIGRHCVITGHCGLSGSVTLGDGVMLGGRVGVADHITIGAGSQVAATSAVMNDIGPGQRWAGLPAQPIKEFFREIAIVRSLAREKRDKRDDK